ncbi:MAG: methyltransferase domain-containing protein [Anaerolineales bacterium]|jgi:SAM-dependent methyltransferase
MTETNFFSQGSPYLDHPLLTPERTAREIDFILSQIDLPPGGQVLDVGCGTGRHCIELARRGYHVVGIDPAEAMLSAARHATAEAGVTVELRQVRGEELAEWGTFDAAICLFTTLGQMQAGEDNRALLERVAQALQPGGFLALEVPQRDWVAQNLKTNERIGEGENYTLVTRRFEPAEKAVLERFTRVSPQGERVYRLRYRLFNHPELENLLVRAGFEILGAYEGYAKVPITENSATMLFVARKS